MTPREMVDRLHAGQPGWFQCHCGHWYTALGLEKHESKCLVIPEEEKSPYNIRCLTFL